VTGDADVVQAQSPGSGATTWRRLAAWIKAKLGWAMLSVLVGTMAVQSMTSSGTFWPPVSAAPALVAAWLVGCAAAVLPHARVKWATLALAVTAVAAIPIWPALVFPPGL